MVIFQILLLSDKRVISKERNTVRASNPRASLTWTDNTSKLAMDAQADLSLRWAQIHFIGFVMSWLNLSFRLIFDLWVTNYFIVDHHEAAFPRDSWYNWISRRRSCKLIVSMLPLYY